MSELIRPRLMLVTDRGVAGGEDVLVEKTALAVEGGVDWVQVREKDMSLDDRIRLVRRIVKAVAGRAMVVVNGSLQEAEEGGADGVHLPESADMVRRHGMIVGRSVHSLPEASAAEEEGVDYIVAGPVFATATHAGMNPLGLGLITDIAEGVATPVIAIGGINAHRAAGVIVTGASGIAVVRALLEASDPRLEARVLREAMEGEGVVKITLNGKPHSVEGDVSVAELVELLGVKPQVAVAVNGEVVRRADWNAAWVREGDVVEIVRAVGGGSR